MMAWIADGKELLGEHGKQAEENKNRGIIKEKYSKVGVGEKLYDWVGVLYGERLNGTAKIVTDITIVTR